MSENMPPVFTVQNEDSSSEILLICDHASRYIPSEYNDLGIEDISLLHRHIAWDIGVRDVTTRLSDRLNVTAVYSEFSRLLIDANRYPDDTNSIPDISDGIDIPANKDIDDVERTRRLNTWFWPHHNKIDELISVKSKGENTPVLIAMHSFTPIMHGIERPWHIGVLWDQDNRVAEPMLGYLRKNPTLVVGDNEPYNARVPLGYSMNEYGTKRKLPHVCIEIRQDLIDTHHGAESWANIVADAISQIRGDVRKRLAG